ncbi:magnesium transporter [Amaricoccus sp.]
MDPRPISVTVDTDREDVAKTIERYDILAVPVVDAEGRPVGIVTHDDAADAIQAEATEDFQRISTVLPFTQSLREAGIGVLYSKRIVWLTLLVFGNLFSDAGVAHFGEKILASGVLPAAADRQQRQCRLAIGHADGPGPCDRGCGAEGLARPNPARTGHRGGARRVHGAGGPSARALRGGPQIALVVGLTMFLVVIVGSLVGMSLPFLLSRLRLDPATASGPLVTTISDGVGVVVYSRSRRWYWPPDQAVHRSEQGGRSGRRRRHRAAPAGSRCR